MFKLFEKKGFWILLFTALILILVIKLGSSNSQSLSGASQLVRETYAPLQKGVDLVQQGLIHIGTKLLGVQSLEERLQAEADKNQQLSLENMQLRQYKAEVERLRALLDYQNAQSAQYTLEATRVIARGANNWYNTLTIDKGTDFGLAVNMPVITPEGLVGKIINVSSNSAQVLLITDRELAVGAILQQTRENRGIVEGVGDGQLKMINIPYYSPVQEGEPVVTSGLSQVYPPGIQIGTVITIQKEANGLVQSAYVQPAVNFNRLEEVLVIKAFRAVTQPAEKGV